MSLCFEQKALSVTPSALTLVSQHHRIIQVGRDLRRPCIQTPPQSWASSEVRPGWILFYFLVLSKKEEKEKRKREKGKKKSEKKEGGGRVEGTHRMDFADNYLAVTF